MKQALIIWLFCLFVLGASAQPRPTDSLYQLIQETNDDSLRGYTMIRLCSLLKNVDPDSARRIAVQAQRLAQVHQRPHLEATSLLHMATMDTKKGEFEKAMPLLNTSLKMFRTVGDSLSVADVLQAIGNIHRRQGAFSEALKVYLQCADLRETHHASPGNLASSYINIGNVYYFIKEYDKARENYELVLKTCRARNDLEGVVRIYNNLFAVVYAQERYEEGIQYLEKALHLSDSLRLNTFKAANLSNLGELYRALKNYPKALRYSSQALDLYTLIDDKARISMVLKNMGQLHEESGDYERAIGYFQQSLDLARSMKHRTNALEAYRTLSEAYAKTGQYPAAYETLTQYDLLKDSLNDERSNKELNKLRTAYETEKKEEEIRRLQEKEARSQREKQLLLVGILLLAIIGFAALWANWQRQKAMRFVKLRKEEAERLLAEKEQMQEQLIQIEKMSTIGQLTAGVAHEINNPINFISSNAQALQQDFDELDELLQLVTQLEGADPPAELIEALRQKSRTTDAKMLRREIGQLLQGILHGTERTIGIVNSLRNFSRSTNEYFEEADIHEALDAALLILSSRIGPGIDIKKAYGQLPPVNCQINKLNQVFVNIINNALQAIGTEGRLTITTTADAQTASISISDDGPGMDAPTLARIFEPFFTTKAAGQGTGLGLSISQNIIQAHGGSIAVSSQAGHGTTFVIHLPLKKL
ncbi:MAG: tetratricopeptide repeat protein [Bacteroidota bacterium]